ncbi:YraN family protein [Pantoea sp. BRM17]|nr:YraN family protein [Pantoea sp. BRM17]
MVLCRTELKRVLLKVFSGAEHEQQARHYLERAGLKWVASNVRFRGGELDLIMRDADCWVFVEVRYRRDARYGGAAASVTRQKQAPLRDGHRCLDAGNAV